MAITQTSKDNIAKGLGQFVEAFRYYIVEKFSTRYGTQWHQTIYDSLTDAQKDNWQKSAATGTEPKNILDFTHFHGIAVKNKDLFRSDFDKNVNNLPTWLSDIAAVRHQSAHYHDINEDAVLSAWLNMKKIAKAIGMSELEETLQKLQNDKGIQKDPSVSMGLQPWFRVVEPHDDIKNGHLDESVFAANLAEVSLGTGREVYNNPALFFSKTYFTSGLKTVAKRVIKGLNGEEAGENRVISLQTGFGGGKTHTLISLYHLAKWGKIAKQSPTITEQIDVSALPNFDKANIAVFTNTTNNAATGRTTETGTKVQTLWGEIAYQLGGETAYNLIRQNDEEMIAPGSTDFKKVLAHCSPALILIDELADYCVKASGRRVVDLSLADQTISFMQDLTEAVSGTPQCVLVLTLPASPQEVGNTEHAQNILSSLQKRVSRISADTQPVTDDEIYEVIRRRLFNDIGDRQSVEQAIDKYTSLYLHNFTDLPSDVTKSEYRQKMLKSYPFHPELIDIFRTRWAAHHDFQRTRGALKLLANIAHDLWKRRQSLPSNNLLIHAGDANLANLDAVSGQLKKLYGNGYDAVITADVTGSSSNAYKIDGEKKEYGDWFLTQGIATIILLNSFGSDGANKGINLKQLKLNLIKPDGFNHNNVNGALDLLETKAHYLYYAIGESGKNYWFYTKPNINILVNQAKSEIKDASINEEITRRIKDRTKAVSAFNVLIDPTKDMPEQHKLTLAIVTKYTGNAQKMGKDVTKYMAEVATQRGHSSRINRNTLLFLLCSEMGENTLKRHITDYLACQKISLEYNSQLEREQRDDIKRKMDEAAKHCETSLAAAYSMVVKPADKKGNEVFQLKDFKDSLDTQINQNVVALLKTEQLLLDNIGLGTLRKHNLLPTPSVPLRVKDVYEAFLKFDDKPMITRSEVVKESLLKFYKNEEFGFGYGDGTHFTKLYFQENISHFDVTDDTYWLIDKSLKPQPKPVTLTEPPTVSSVSEPAQPTPSVSEPPKHEVKKMKSVTVSGKIGLDLYSHIFTSFVMPLKDYGVEIEFKIKGKSNAGRTLTESSPEYKSIKESAKQLGLNLSEEELNS